MTLPKCKVAPKSCQKYSSYSDVGNGDTLLSSKDTLEVEHRKLLGLVWELFVIYSEFSNPTEPLAEDVGERRKEALDRINARHLELEKALVTLFKSTLDDLTGSANASATSAGYEAVSTFLTAVSNNLNDLKATTIRLMNENAQLKREIGRMEAELIGNDFK